MRYDTPIYFQQLIPGDYDPKTGNYGEDQVRETQRLAAVMETNTETMRILYGTIRQGSVTVHLQNRYEQTYDRIRIGDRVYQVDRRKKLRVKKDLVLTEVV